MNRWVTIGVLVLGPHTIFSVGSGGEVTTSGGHPEAEAHMTHALDPKLKEVHRQYYHTEHVCLVQGWHGCSIPYPGGCTASCVVAMMETDINYTYSNNNGNIYLPYMP